MSTNSDYQDNFLAGVEKLAHGLTFPIKNRGDLVSALGGDHASVDWMGERHNVGQAAQVVPEYLFPIESMDELKTHAVNLELARPGTGLTFKAADEQPADPHRKAPHNPVGKPQKSMGRGQGGPALGKGSKKGPDDEGQ